PKGHDIGRKPKGADSRNDESAGKDLRTTSRRRRSFTGRGLTPSSGMYSKVPNIISSFAASPYTTHRLGSGFVRFAAELSKCATTSTRVPRGSAMGVDG